MDVRLPMLLRKGGVDAVLGETALLASDYVRSRYYAGLLRATKLSTSDLTRLLRQAASLMKSDYYSAELIGAVGGQSLEDVGVRVAVAEIVDHMESDYYRSESIGKLTKSGTPTANELDLIVKTAGRISSDYYKQETLSALLRSSGPLAPAARRPFIETLGTIREGVYFVEAPAAWTRIQSYAASEVPTLVGVMATRCGAP
jgi:hypothetical protein